MNPKAFSQPAWIEFEGERVFRLLSRYPDYARFELIGFEGQIFINEYRYSCLQVLDAILSKQQDYADFAYSFSSPAFVNIPNIEAKPLEVTLTETEEIWPSYMMLVQIGTEEGFITTDSIINRANTLAENKQAIFSLYSWPIHSASLISSPSPQAPHQELPDGFGWSLSLLPAG